jgi:opine dehydrogenase
MNRSWLLAGSFLIAAVVVPMAALGRLAGVPTPTMDALIHLASLSLGIDFNQAGLTLEKLGIAGMTPAQLLRFVEETA